MKKIIVTQGIHSVLERESSFLDRSGIRIHPSASNTETLELHRSAEADLIIANLLDESMAGDELCALIRSNENIHDVSIILLSPDTPADLERCSDCGANAVVEIPVNTAVLLQEAHQLLNVALRKSCRVPVSIKLTGTSREKPFTGSAENVSASGMMFTADALLYEGDTVTCSFALPGESPMRTAADVIRVIEKGTAEEANLYGIAFTDPTARVFSALEEFVERECQHV
jgi:CheY-like chemotaxis protein